MKYTPEQEELMRQLRIPKGANVQFIGMGPGRVEPKTAGWTDAQIRAKSIKELDAMVASAEKVAASLRKSLQEQEERITDLRLVRRRHKDLGA